MKYSLFLLKISLDVTKFVGLDLGSTCLQRLSADDTSGQRVWTLIRNHIMSDLILVRLVGFKQRIYFLFGNH